MVKTLSINGKIYTAHVEVVRESDEIKARAASERLSEYGAYLAEQVERRDKGGRDKKIPAVL